MDQPECKTIVDNEAERLALRLGIPHWDLLIECVPLPDDEQGWTRRGNVEIKPEYNKAHIRLNPEAFSIPPDVLKTLRHEMLHVVLSPFDQFLAIIRPVLERNKTVEKMALAAWTQSAEKAVINLERMYRGLVNEDPEPPIAAKEP